MAVDPRRSKDYADFLRAAGFAVWEIEGIFWFRYNGFLRPAYLPHCTPAIDTGLARRALKESGCAFVRWDSDFGTLTEDDWWYVVRSGPYDLRQVSGNTRSKIRRGMRRLQARPATVAEIRAQGMKVCRKAVQRYGRAGFLPDEQDFNRKLSAAEAHPESMEFFGVFSDDTLVGFSENHMQEDAVFWESIWYDPDSLGDYSSYLLTHEMLEHYLNQRRVRYVSDGSRSLYHDTNVQQFFIKKFGFERRPARMRLVYAPWLKLAIGVLFPLRGAVARLKNVTRMDVLERVHGLMQQERIARAYRKTRGGLR